MDYSKFIVSNQKEEFITIQVKSILLYHIGNDARKPVIGGGEQQKHRIRYFESIISKLATGEFQFSS